MSLTGTYTLYSKVIEKKLLTYMDQSFFGKNRLDYTIHNTRAKNDMEKRKKMEKAKLEFTIWMGQPKSTRRRQPTCKLFPFLCMVTPLGGA